MTGDDIVYTLLGTRVIEMYECQRIVEKGR